MASKRKQTKPEPVAEPVNGNRLSECAMLVELNISAWRAARIDREISDEVAKQHGASADMGKYRKLLVDPKVLVPMRNKADAARKVHNQLTLPWSDGGVRILSSAGYFQYTEKMRETETEFWKEFREVFLPGYPEYVKQGRKLLNGMGRNEDYPSATAIQNKFGFRVHITPMPDASDFRVQLGDAEKANVQGVMERQLHDRVKTAMQDVWLRMQDVVSRMVERLNLYSKTKDGKVENSFRDSLVTNVTDVLELVPVLNVTGDQNLTKFAERIKAELTAYDPDTLRDNEKTRKDVARRAEEILNKMEGFLK